MNIESWKQAWEANNIGFHKMKPHPQLVAFLSELNLAPGSRIFLPLCGKTLDISWLLSQGYKVVGAEVSQLAVDQLFQELGMEPKISVIEQGSIYRSDNIDIFVGDIFDLDQAVLGSVDAIYDRAALVALPLELRSVYTQHLMDISDTAPQLVITFEYDQQLKGGPPFSVDADEIEQHYAGTYACRLLHSFRLPNGLKGASEATENIWLISSIN